MQIQARPIVDDQTLSVTIYRSGTLSLNHTAYVAIGRPAAVELLYDRRSRTIGLRPTDGRRPHAYPVRSVSGRRSGPFIVSAQAFLRFYELPVDQSRRWVAAVDDDMLVITLESPAVTVTATNSGL